uniref:BED-type domain-containing protein n=1 Tax=Xiphophorus maculatus TaxID=8083 RepID=M3ZI76_XIPMA
VEEESTTTAVGEAKFAEVESLESHPWPHLKDYFFFEARDKSNEKTLHFQCVLCQPKKITIKGQAKSLYNLKSHINRKHPALSVNSSASSQSSQPCAKRARHPSFGETSSKTAGTDVSQSMVDKQIVDLFVHNIQPTSVISVPINLLQIKVVITFYFVSLGDVTYPYIYSVYLLIVIYMQKVTELLEDIPWVATTADCWSAHNKSYLGMTAHWLDPKTRARRHALLAWTRVKGHHSSDVLAQAMLVTHSKFNLQDKVTRTTTDNGKNFVKRFVQFGAEAEFLPNIPEAAADSEEDWIQDVDPEAGGVEYISVDATLDKSSNLGLELPTHMKCAAHSFNLVASVDASEALNCALFRSAYRKTMSKARALWNLQSRSTVAAACIFDALKRRLAVPTGTRWNSTYDSVVVLNSLLEKNRDAVNRVMTQLKLQTFTDSDVGFLSEYGQVMCIIAKALDKIQGEDQAYLGSLLPTVAATVMRLKEVKLKRLLHCSPLVDATLAGISKRFGPLLEDLECQLAAAFHPKFRLFWLEQFNNSQVGRVTKAMEAVVQTALSALSEEGSDTSCNEEDEEDDFFSNITRSCDGRSRRSLKWKAQNLVKTWLEAGSKDAMTDRAFLGEQVLIDLFIKYNTPVPSSAAVGRLFCQGNDVLRVSLSDINFESLMFMKGNQHHIEDMTKAQLE